MLFTLLQAIDWNTRPRGNDTSDVVFGHFLRQQGTLALKRRELLFGFFQIAMSARQITIGDLRGTGEVADTLHTLDLDLERFDLALSFADLVDDRLFISPLGHQAGGFFAEVRLLLPNFIEAGHGGLVGFLFECFFLHFQLEDLALEHVNLRRHRIKFDFQTGGCFVDEIHCLIWQKSAGNVAIRHHSGRDESTILDAYAVMNFIALLETAQNGDRVLDRWFTHHHWLEASF